MTTPIAPLALYALAVYVVGVWPVLGRARYRSLQRRLRNEEAGARTRAQGWSGIAQGCLGVAFSLVYIATGSLLFPVVILANGIEDGTRIVS